MTDHALASFEAKDGTGRWEVFTWGIIGQRPALPLHEAVPYRVRRPAGAHRETRLSN